MEMISLNEYKIIHKKVVGGTIHFVSEGKGILTHYIACPKCENLISTENGIHFFKYGIICSNESCKHEFGIVNA